jgi:biopolymer transport protein ExbD
MEVICKVLYGRLLVLVPIAVMLSMPAYCRALDSSSPADASPSARGGTPLNRFLVRVQKGESGLSEGVQLAEGEPQDPHAQRNRQLVVSIHKDGKVFLNQQPTTPEDLHEAIMRLAGTHPGGMPDLRTYSVFIVADPATPYRRVIQIVDTFQSLEMRRVIFTRPPEL